MRLEDARIGMFVRIVKQSEDNPRPDLVGKIGTVVELRPDKRWPVMVYVDGKVYHCLLEELEPIEEKKLTLQAGRHHTLGCPKCGGELRVVEMRNIRGDEEWEMECSAGHRCLLLWDFWEEPQVEIFVTML